MHPLAAIRFHREHAWTARRISAYLDGELNAPQRERAERHFDLCPQCRQVMRTLRRLIPKLAELHGRADTDVTANVLRRLRDET